MTKTHLINGRAELSLHTNFEITSAVPKPSRLFFAAIASIATLAGKNGQSGSFALPFIK
jgi:hypothetical protein